MIYMYIFSIESIKPWLISAAERESLSPADMSLENNDLTVTFKVQKLEKPAGVSYSTTLKALMLKSF